MIKYLVSVDAEGVVQGSAQYDDEVEGAYESLTLVPGEVFMEVDEPFVRNREHTAVLNGRAVNWEDRRQLAEIKAAKNAEINAARLKANRTSFNFDGKDIAADELSRSDIDAVSSEVSLTGQLPATFPFGWKAIDNTYVSIPDVETWIRFVKAMVNQGTTNFIYSQTLKAELNSANTCEAVSAIKW